MKIISLFSGCGGLDLGFEKAGFEIIWANEFDKTIHETYRYNHPQTELNTRDIREINESDIPDSDGIIGGPPCQSWSLGGKCLGINDERGKLVFDYIRIVKDKKTKFFIMENVPGMVTPRHIQSFEQFLHLFREAGYQVKYELLNAADYRIPQDRLRVFIVGIRADIKNEYFFPTKVSETPITLSQAIGDLKEQPTAYLNEKVNQNYKGVLNHDYYNGGYDSKFMARNRIRGWQELSFTIQAQAKNEPLHPQAPKMEYVSQNERRFAMGHEKEYRRLSVRECARIQTFPDHFRFIYSNIKDGYKMVGNAVPPRLAYYLALSVKDCLASNVADKKKYMLVGYVKSDYDLSIIKKHHVYYIRGGNRPGAMQYGQIQQVDLLVLHHGGNKYMFKLDKNCVVPCTSKDLMIFGFHPHGNEYWRIEIQEEIPIDRNIIGRISSFTKYPQIIGF